MRTGKTSWIFVTAAIPYLLHASAIQAAEPTHRAHTSQHAAASQAGAGDPYLLPIDIVSGEKLDAHGKPVTIIWSGREIRFASRQSAKQFLDNPARYVAELDRQMIRQQLPFYPLTTCVVSGQPLGEMGDPVDIVRGNRLVRLCCAECRDAFAKAPGKSLAALDKAVIARQAADYPLDTCAVSGSKLGAMGKPVDHVAGNHLVRFCCAGCIKRFTSDPLAALAKLDKTAKAAPVAASDTPSGVHGGTTHGATCRH